MRIISGKYKGQTLETFSASHIRPTTDRVKETLFNILQFEIPGARVLDLFSGTGNLGLEALSRGASEVVFVESHPKSLGIIRKNLLKLKVTDPHTVIAQDVFQFLEKTNHEDPFDLIFVDPPFTMELADDVLKAVSKSALWTDHTKLAIESAKREKVAAEYGQIIRVDQRIFGDKILSFFSHPQAPEA